MKRMTITCLDDMDPVFRGIRSMLEIKGKLDVFFRPFKVDRSTEQNALYWLWMTEIANHTGSTKEEMAEYYKEKFLLGIFYRDDPEYAEMADSIKAIKEHSEADYQSIRKQVIALTSTTKCSVKQMREYLNNIKVHAVTEVRANLTMPELQGLI